MSLEELVDEALTEPTFRSASNYDAAQYWANLARNLARGINEYWDDAHGNTGL